MQKLQMKKVRCPSCKQWSSWKGNPYKPFCSEKCKSRDLGNWATEQYRIPVEEESKKKEGGDKD